MRETSIVRISRQSMTGRRTKTGRRIKLTLLQHFMFMTMLWNLAHLKLEMTFGIRTLVRTASNKTSIRRVFVDGFSMHISTSVTFRQHQLKEYSQKIHPLQRKIKWQGNYEKSVHGAASSQFGASQWPYSFTQYQRKQYASRLFSSFSDLNNDVVESRGRRDFITLPPLLIASGGSLMSSSAANARGLVQFPCKNLGNTYSFIRAGESLLEEDNIISTNPLFATNVENKLSDNGRAQVLQTTKTLEKLPNFSVVRYAIQMNSVETADLIGQELKIGRSSMVPEFNFLDPRAVGRWDQMPLFSTKAAVWAMDATEAGESGMKGNPPPNEDGTPNETLADHRVRLQQLLSVLETQYSGDNILLVFPDDTGPALLTALIGGIPLRRTHELNFLPGEFMYNVTMERALERLRAGPGKDYQEIIERGLQELGPLRDNPDQLKNVKDLRYAEEQARDAEKARQKKEEEERKIAIERETRRKEQQIKNAEKRAKDAARIEQETQRKRLQADALYQKADGRKQQQQDTAALKKEKAEEARKKQQDEIIAINAKIQSEKQPVAANYRRTSSQDIVALKAQKTEEARKKRQEEIIAVKAKSQSDKQSVTNYGRTSSPPPSYDQEKPTEFLSIFDSISSPVKVGLGVVASVAALAGLVVASGDNDQEDTAEDTLKEAENAQGTEFANAGNSEIESGISDGNGTRKAKRKDIEAVTASSSTIEEILPDIVTSLDQERVNLVSDHTLSSHKSRTNELVVTELVSEKGSSDHASNDLKLLDRNMTEVVEPSSLLRDGTKDDGRDSPEASFSLGKSNGNSTVDTVYSRTSRSTQSLSLGFELEVDPSVVDNEYGIINVSQNKKKQNTIEDHLQSCEDMKGEASIDNPFGDIVFSKKASTKTKSKDHGVTPSETANFQMESSENVIQTENKKDVTQIGNEAASFENNDDDWDDGSMAWLGVMLENMEPSDENNSGVDL